MLKRFVEFITEDCWWTVQDFWKDYVYPAYRIKNFFFERFDLVKMPEIKRSEYSDVSERVLWANFELIKFFIEKEKPEKHIVWYGKDGHTYGEGSIKILFPERKDQYIMDIIKEIYGWITKGRIQMKKEYDYVLDFWCTWLSGRRYSVPCLKDPEFLELKIDKSTLPKDMSFFDDKDVDWEILDKYLDGDRKNILIEDYLFKKISLIEEQINEKDKEYLHLGIEVRQYLWT